jgi:hypothetical protein
VGARDESALKGVSAARGSEAKKKVELSARKKTDYLLCLAFEVR